MKKLGKYIFTQRLRRLKYPSENPLPIFSYIDALGEHPQAKRAQSYQANTPLPDEDELWPVEPNRNQFLADQRIRRLCVTVEGGVGKSQLLAELEATCAYDCPDQFVLKFELRELPTRAAHFMNSGSKVLVQRAFEEFEDLQNQPEIRPEFLPEFDELANMIRAAATYGKLTLIIDAFDQLDKQAAEERAKALGEFLGSLFFPKIRCVIAGRPYAIKRVWEVMNLGELRSAEVDNGSETVAMKQPVWEFCKLSKFDKDQVKEYLSAVSPIEGAEKLNALKRMNAEEIHLPRTLNIIRQLTDGELSQMQTAADLYWHAMNKTIDENFRFAKTDYRLEHLEIEYVLPIVAAVSFAMMFWKDQPVLEVPSIAGDRARDFFKFMERAGFFAVLADDEMNIDIKRCLLDLAEVDSESIQFHFYSESPGKERRREIKDIRLSDPTVRDFFAAHWAARYFDLQLKWIDNQFLSGELPAELKLRSRLAGRINSDDFNRFWRLLVGMPDCGMEYDEEASTESSWVSAVRPLFSTKTQERPTELMYRCWPDLLWRAGYMSHRDHVDIPDWNETPMAAGTLLAQREVRSRFEKQQAIPTEHAKGLVEEFLRDYLVQVESQKEVCLSDPIATPDIRTQFYLDCKFVPIDISEIPNRSESSEVERKESLCYLNERYPLYLFERSFREVEGGPFLYGDDPDPSTPKRVDAFEINAYLLSESMYGCFDRRRRVSKANRARNNLNWYDGLMYSIWSHGRLAGEIEWEAASRGKMGDLRLTSHWDYGFAGGKTNLPKYADYNRHYSEDPSGIGHRYPTTKYELYDVHGQLWEWCSTQEGGAVRRGLCGGSFSYDRFSACCSFRFHDHSYFGIYFTGCRVARARNQSS